MTKTTKHVHTDQSGTYRFTVTAPLFAVTYDGDTHYARMVPWKVQEWSEWEECAPLDDTLTQLDGGAIIYDGIAYSLEWEVSATIGLV